MAWTLGAKVPERRGKRRPLPPAGAVIAVAVWLCAGGVTAAAASGFRWSAPMTLDHRARTSISCPSNGFCAGADNHGDLFPLRDHVRRGLGAASRSTRRTWTRSRVRRRRCAGPATGTARSRGSQASRRGLPLEMFPAGRPRELSRPICL